MKKRILSLLLSMVLTIGLLPLAAADAAAADPTVNFTNLVIFCRFDGEEEFINTEYADTKVRDIIDNSYNTSEFSVADYFRTVSVGKMNMQTLYLLDKAGASLELSKQRGYYAKKTDDNPIGFEGSGSLRISELMRDWGDAVNKAIAAGAMPVDAAGNEHSFAELDKNKDGQIDLITVIYKNTVQTNITVGHGDPLWDYHYTYNGVSAQEGNATYTSNHYVQLTCNYANDKGPALYRDKDKRAILANHGTICHETMHGLNLLDLYGGSSDANKVGYMSLMSKPNSPIPQFISAKEREALGWLDGQVQTMTGSGSYTLKPAVSTTGTVAYKVDLSTGKTLYLEYRQFDQPNNRYDYYKRDITYIQSQSEKPNEGTKFKNGLVCYLATTDKRFPSYGDLDVVSIGQYDTKTDCAVGLNETLRDKIYSDGKWIDITVTAMDANSQTFSITGLPESEEKALSSIAISGGSSMTVPPQNSSAATLSLTATANYSDGSTADVTSAAAWSLTGEYAGVSVSGGVVTVAPDTAAGSVTIQAEYQEKKDTHAITLTAAGGSTTADATISADKTACTYGYAAAEAPTFTAAVTGAAAGAEVSYKWYVAGVEQVGETGSGFAFPTGKSVGSYTVKCTASVDSHEVTSNEITVTVGKATLTASQYSAPTANTGLTYTGSEQQLLNAAGTCPEGATKHYSLDKTNWKTSIPEIQGKDAKTYTVYWYIDGGTNYNDVGSAENPAGTLTVTIAPKTIAITSANVASKTYDNSTAADVTAVTFDSAVLTLGTDYRITNAAFDNKDAGQGRYVTYTVELLNPNYAFANGEESAEGHVLNLAIQKAAAPTGLANLAVNRRTGDSTDQTVTVTAVGMPTDAGTVKYSLDSYNNSDLGLDIDSDTGVVTISKVSGSAGESKTFTVKLKSTNYEDATVIVTVTLTSKDLPALSDLQPIRKTYDGIAVPASAITGTAADGETPVEGTWSWTGGAPQNVADSGNISVTFTPTNLTDYAPVTGTVTVTITPAALTGAPIYTTISTGGKKLTDAALKQSTGWPAGTIKWTDGNGTTLADDTAIEQGKSYHWIFAQTSDSNYVGEIEGDIVLWANAPTPSAPSGGGGGGSSSGSTSSSTTVTVPVTSESSSVSVKAEISKEGAATVEISDKQIEEVAQHGSGTVTVDVSKLENVESVQVPAHVVETTNKAEGTGLTVALPAGSVTLDETALESVSGSDDVTVAVQQVSATDLTEAQQKAIGDTASIGLVVDVDLFVGAEKQSTFNGGTLTISVPYTPKSGEDTSKLTVWFIRDDGTIENRGGYYDAEKKCFVFETEHLSRYLLVSVNEQFSDVAADAYYAAAVNWAVSQNITDGIGGGKFGPDLACTRAQIVTFLWRAAGCPVVNFAMDFSDVDEAAFYGEAVRWAASLRIVGGYGNGLFGTNDAITREQMTAILYRYAQSVGMDTTQGGMSVREFADYESVSDYARDAMRWAVNAGIVQGYNGKLMPADTCTRAQIVTMLYRLLGE